MKTTKKISLTLLFILSGTVFLSAQSQSQLMSFEEALRYMTEQNPSLQQAKQQIKQKEFEVKAKRGLRLPQVAVSARAVAMSEMIHLDLTPVQEAISPLYSTLGNFGVFSGVPNPGNPSEILPDDISTAVVRKQLLEGGEAIANTDWNNVIQEKNFATVSANFIWPIYTGGKINGANKAADVGIDISREKLRTAEGILLTELATRYYGLTLSMQVFKVRQQMFDGIEQHYSNAQKLYDNGMIAKVELLHAKVSRNEAERELKQAERNIDIIRAGLDATLSFDSTINVHPTSHLFMNNNISPIIHWIDSANTKNPQIQQIYRNKELVEIKNKVNKGNYLPTIAMTGSYELVEKNFSPYLPHWLVGVGMKWSVFEGMGRRNKIKVGETMQSQVDFAGQKAEADVKAYLTKLYEELQMHMEQKTQLESTLELANEYAKSTEKAFSEGFATSVSVVDANNKVTQVKVMRLKVFYDYDVTLAKLMQTAGVPEQYINFCSGENTIIEAITE